jgi:hypothetical protein
MTLIKGTAELLHVHCHMLHGERVGGGEDNPPTWFEHASGTVEKASRVREVFDQFTGEDRIELAVKLHAFGIRNENFEPHSLQFPDPISVGVNAPYFGAR